MADTPQTLSLITEALAQNFRPQVVRQINRRSVLLQMIKIERGQGKNVAFDIEGDGAVAETFSDGADAANFGSDVISPATLPFALLRANFRVTDLALAAAQNSASPRDLLRLLARNMDNAATKLASTINAQLFTSTGSSNSIIGLTTALRDDNTYATIDRSDSANAHWRSNVIDANGDTLSFGMLRSAIGDTIYTASGEQPALAFCKPDVFNAIGSLFQEQRRYNDTVRTLQGARGEVKLDAGVGSLEVEGCVFIKDKDAPSSQIVFVNPEHVAFEYLPPANEPEFSDQAREQGATDGYGAIPLGFRVKHLARLGASEKFSMHVYGQLRVDRPNSCGRLTNFVLPT